MLKPNLFSQLKFFAKNLMTWARSVIPGPHWTKPLKVHINDDNLHMKHKKK